MIKAIRDFIRIVFGDCYWAELGGCVFEFQCIYISEINKTGSMVYLSDLIFLNLRPVVRHSSYVWLGRGEKHSNNTSKLIPGVSVVNISDQGGNLCLIRRVFSDSGCADIWRGFKTSRNDTGKSFLAPS